MATEQGNRSHKEFSLGSRGLDRIRNASTENKFRNVLYGLARGYAPYLGVDFDRDILPNVGNKAWWEADYIEGSAIGMSIKDAFRCLIDVHRTFQIAQGVRETISYLKQHKTDPLSAIDAGAGTGILSILLAAHGVDRTTSIELNPETAEATRDFIERCGLEDRITVVQGDATKIDLGSLGVRNADILVSENLSVGFMDEPQFDIISHLSQFLALDAKILPYSGQLSVALGNADWEGIPEIQTEIAVRRLRKWEQLSESVQYAQIESAVGMDVPTIEGDVVLPTRRGKAINTLLVSTRFQVNEVGKHYFIDPDSTEFLGKTWAFRIRDEITGAEEIPVHLGYRAGRRKNVLQVNRIGSSLSLSD